MTFLIHLKYLQSSWEDEDTGKIYSCVDLYFVSQVNCSYGKKKTFDLSRLIVYAFLQDGSTFKVKYKFPPYFYAATKVSLSLCLNHKMTFSFSVA